MVRVTSVFSGLCCDMAGKESLLKFQKSGFKMKVSKKNADDWKINLFKISIG
jgi:hypothetical protein